MPFLGVGRGEKVEGEGWHSTILSPIFTGGLFVSTSLYTFGCGLRLWPLAVAVGVWRLAFGFFVFFPLPLLLPLLLPLPLPLPLPQPLPLPLTFALAFAFFFAFALQITLPFALALPLPWDLAWSLP